MKKSKYAAMFILRPDGRYQGYWHELDKDGQPKGKRHTICDRDPEKLYQRILEKETPAARTLRQVAEEWSALHRESVKNRTWANYKPQLELMLARFGDIPMADITAADVNRDLLSAKAQSYSFTVVNTRRSLWRMICDYAVGCQDIPYNPALSVKNPKGLQKGRRSAPEDDVLTAVLEEGDSTEFPFIPYFLLCTGVRRSEALHRKKADVDTSAWELRIPSSKTAAGVRTVPIIEPLRAPLKRWMDAHPGPWLFPRIEYYAGRKGVTGHMTDSNWETAWQHFCEAHGWTDEDGKPVFGAHNLRHGTATLLYESGVDVYAAQHILGHASVATTLQIYTDLRKKHEKKTAGKFGRQVKKVLSKTRKPVK